MGRQIRYYGILGFAALMIAAFFARGYGLDFPPYHWDELLDFNNVFSAFHNHLLLLNYGHGSLHPYLILIVWKIYLLFTGAESTAGALLYSYFANPEPFFSVARGLVAMISTISVAMVFFLARKLYNERVGWLSAILLAGTFLHASESHFASSIHVLSTLFILLTLYFCQRIMENGSRRDYILAGMSFGLAVAAQYAVVTAVFPILYAHLKKASVGKNRNPLAILFDRSLLLSGGVAVIAFFLVTPYAALDFQRFAVEMQQILGNVTRVWIDSNGQPVWLFYFTEHLRHGMGTLLSLTSIAGLIYALIRRSRSDCLLGIFLLASFVSLARSANFARYLVPSLPALAILAAALLDDVLHFLESKMPKPTLQFLSITITTGLLLQPVTNIIRFDFWLTQPDTRQIASEWMIANLPYGSHIVIEGADVLGPTVPPGRAYMEQMLNIQKDGSLGEVYTQAMMASQPFDTGYKVLSVFRIDQKHVSGIFLETIPDASYYRDLGYDYIVTTSWMQRSTADEYSQAFRSSLEKYYEPIMVFKPTIYFRYDPYAWRMDYDALAQVIPGKEEIGGPILTIYKLREKPSSSGGGM